jgi:hypothetical protein
MRRSFAVLLAVAAALALPGLANADFIVTDNSDNPADPGSLRYAIDNITPGNNTITFAASLDGQTIILTNGPLTISQNATITGLGAGQLTISGNNASQVFVISSGVTASISDLTITGGSGISGGGIINHIHASLTLTNVTLSNNNAGVGGGGGIYNEQATLTVNDSTFSDNSGTYGGGIVNSGTVTINNSTFTGNSASYGGGIYNGSGGQVTLNYTTLTDNTASVAGGDLYLDSGNGSTYSGTGDVIDDGSYLSDFTDSSISPVPEPSSLLFVVSSLPVGLLAYGIQRRWRV